MLKQLSQSTDGSNAIAEHGGTKPVLLALDKIVAAEAANATENQDFTGVILDMCTCRYSHHSLIYHSLTHSHHSNTNRYDTRERVQDKGWTKTSQQGQVCGTSRGCHGRETR